MIKKFILMIHLKTEKEFWVIDLIVLEQKGYIFQLKDKLKIKFRKLHKRIL